MEFNFLSLINPADANEQSEFALRANEVSE